ncbi:MAG: lysophospholipid acyltransferase family protein, partial [Bacteroidota bacterium]
VVYFVLGYRRKVVLNNLRKAFPDKSEKEIKTISKEFYKRFGEFIVETLKSFTISDSELRRRVNFTNVQDVQHHADNEQSILVIASHIFNWEWALLTGCIVLPFPVDAVYQRLSNKGFDRTMLKSRSRFGGKPIEKSKVLREIIKTKERLRALGMVADQSPRKSSPKYWTDFLNQDTAFFLGPEQIAKVAKYPCYYFNVVRQRRGHYTVELVPLSKMPYSKEGHEIIEAYAQTTEKAIKKDPSGYLWSHKRWKLQKEID